MTTNGKAIAMTVAGLLLAAAPSVHADTKTKEAKVKCAGVNACKGKGGCASDTNSCSGKNACKGKGWTEVTAKECKDGNGTVVADKGAKDHKDEPKKEEKKK